MYYPFGENKGADQLRRYRFLRGYREADLRLSFRICKKPVFSRRGSYEIHAICLPTALKSEFAKFCCCCFFQVKVIDKACHHQRLRSLR